MNSTEIAWRRFLKAEIEAETVPAKDVSLEGKLDTISAQLNRIAVDSERVAATVPDLLGDKGVEEALSNEEVPELDTLAEGGEAGVPGETGAPGEELPQEGEAAEGDAPIGEEDDPEGIFTESEGGEEPGEEPAADGEIAEATEASEDSVQPMADPTSPADEAAVPAESVDEVAGADGAEPAEEGEVPEEGEIPEEGDEAEMDDENIAEIDLDTEEEESDDEEDEYLDVPGEDGDGQEESDEGDEPADEDEEDETPEEADESDKLIAEAKKAMKKSAYLRMIAKAEEECPCECEEEQKTEKIEESEGAATAGSAGMTNAAFGGTDEETEPIQASCAKSVHLFKYGVGPEQTRADGKRGHTGEGQRRANSERARGKYTDRQYAYEAKQKRDKRKAQGASGNKVDRPKTRSKPGLTASGTTRVKPNKEYGKSKHGEHRDKTERTGKAMMSANIPTKHIATMRDVVGHRQRPVAKAIANSDLERPVFGAEPMRKSAPQMGHGVDPKDVTAADWEEYNRIKARRGF